MFRLNESLKVGQIDKLFKNDLVGRRFKKMVVEGNIHKMSKNFQVLKFILLDVCRVNLDQKSFPRAITEKNIYQVIQQYLLIREEKNSLFFPDSQITLFSSDTSLAIPKNSFPTSLKLPENFVFAKGGMSLASFNSQKICPHLYQRALL